LSRFPESFLEELKGRFRLSEYIGRDVALKRSGREFVGLSPFNKEKTPSFYVNDEKNFFCDFSSGKSGDILEWLQEFKRFDFVEAVKTLAEEAGLELPDQDSRSADTDRRRRRLESIVLAAVHYYQDQLKSVSGREARDYLQRRGLTATDIARFQIGYAPNGNTALRDHLLRDRTDLRLEQAELWAAGVLASVDDGRPPYDRYRHRIIFPIFDAAGRPISLGGRALDPNARAKYLNGPDTELFDKGKQLYGLDMARKTLAAGPGPLVVVEGYMDVIACLRAGVAACAPMGTSLTQAQLDLMWRFHSEPSLCFDGDAAGRRAAAKAMDQALPKIGPSRSLRFLTVSGGKDPDEILRTQGADVLRAQISKGVPLAEAIFVRERDVEPLDTPERRAQLRERLRAITRAIGDRDVRNEYAALFKERLDGMRQKSPPQTAQVSTVEAARAIHGAASPVAKALAYWLVRDPARAEDEIETLSSPGFGHPDLDKLAAAAVEWMMDGGAGAEALAQHLAANGLGAVVEQLSDPGSRLSERDAWRAAWRSRVDYLRIEANLQAAKANITGAEGMKNFLALKAQRDRAKAAL
jgi:DNA primase